MTSTQTPSPAGEGFEFGFALRGDREAFVAGDPAGQVESTPVQRFRKDLLAVGEYRHPVRGWTLAVTPGRMAAWCDAFARMRQAGVDVEVTVDHSPRAAAVQGYLVEMFVEGDRLYGIHEMIGQDAIDLARRVKNVSVEIDPAFVDGRGTRYGEAIVRSSLVQGPVVPDQDHFVPIAASRDGDVSSATMQRGPLLLWSAQAMVPAVDAAVSLAGGGAGAGGETVNFSTAATGDAGPGAALVDAGLLDELADFVEHRLDTLVELGRIGPATRDRLAPLLIGAPRRRCALMLARGAAQQAGFDQPLAKTILDALAVNDVPPLGERTAGQALVLARMTPGASDDHPDEPTRQRMTRAAYGG